MEDWCERVRERDLVPIEKGVDVEMDLVFLAGIQGVEVDCGGGGEGFGREDGGGFWARKVFEKSPQRDWD